MMYQSIGSHLRFLIAASCLWTLSATQYTSIVVNPRPIIGVLAQEIYDGDWNTPPNNSYIAASYVKFIEAAGARVVPILIHSNKTYLTELFSKINGLLLPGGSVEFSSSIGTNGYADTANFLIKLAKQANDKGDYFPIWGACLGFEFLIFHEANNKNILTACNAWNVQNKLKFTKDAIGSKLYSQAPKSTVNILATQDVTVNFHHWCLTPDNFTAMGVDTNYTSLSINYDGSSGVKYISSMEHKTYPFFGVQFHPEKIMYEWTTKEKIPHSPDAIVASQYFATFFVNQARRNGHHFDSMEDEDKYLIYQYCPTFTGASGATFNQKYFFPL